MANLFDPYAYINGALGVGGVPYGGFTQAPRDIRPLLDSEYAQAHIKSITIPPGLGWVPAGSVMGIITESTSRKGMYVPNPVAEVSAGLTTAPGLSYLVADGLASAVAWVTMIDSYKYKVGDHLAAADSNTDNASAIDLGAIVSIDRTTYSHIAVITVTNNVTTGITVALGGCIYIQSKTTAPFLQAKGILAGGVWTGLGADAKGGQGNLIFGNARLYIGCLYNYDSVALSDLSGVEDGNILYLK
jgi:hypothetical protein